MLMDWHQIPKDAVRRSSFPARIWVPLKAASGLVDREVMRQCVLSREGVTTIVVVRPETFIGAIVKDTAGVDRYFFQDPQVFLGSVRIVRYLPQDDGNPRSLLVATLPSIVSVRHPVYNSD